MCTYEIDRCAQTGYWSKNCALGTTARTASTMVARSNGGAPGHQASGISSSDVAVAGMCMTKTSLSIAMEARRSVAGLRRRTSPELRVARGSPTYLPFPCARYRSAAHGGPTPTLPEVCHVIGYADPPRNRRYAGDLGPNRAPSVRSWGRCEVCDWSRSHSKRHRRSAVRTGPYWMMGAVSERAAL